MSPQNWNFDGIENDDDSDDDDIVLVSTTKERWEKLHGIDQNKKSQNKADGNFGRNNDLDRDEYGDEDDILVVAVSPTLSRPMENTSQRIMRGTVGFRSSFHLYFVVTGIALSIWVMTRFLKSRKLEPTARDVIDSSNSATFSSKLESKGNATVPNDSKIIESEHSNSSQNRQMSARIHEMGQVDSPQFPSMMASSLSSNVGERNVIIQKMTGQFAQYVRLIEDACVENSLDPSIAPQLAINLQSSQHIVDSQRDIAYQQAMLDNQQRNHDRQRSEEQHRESLRRAQYDPNWKEKLQKIRDDCCYWNDWIGGASRLWWELFLINLSLGVVPVWQRYFYDLQPFHDITNPAMGSHNHKIGLFVKDAALSVLAQVCDCESSSGLKQFPSSTIMGTESTSSWMVPAITTSHILSFNIDIGDAIASLLSVFTSLVNQVLPVPIEYWTCYGYCVILASILLFFSIVCHQGLRILSLPPFLHHVVNIISMALFYGPQRLSRLILTTIMGTVMVVPIMDYNDDDFGGPGGDKQEHEWQQQNRSTLTGYFLLVSLWILMPMLSRKRTYTLYKEAEKRVDPDNFESSFRNGVSLLEQWYREQTTIRYFLLSMYSALVVWEKSQNNRNR